MRLCGQQRREVDSLCGRQPQVAKHSVDGSQRDLSGRSDLDTDRLAIPAVIHRESWGDLLDAHATIPRASRQIQIARERLAVSIRHLEVRLFHLTLLATR